MINIKVGDVVVIRPLDWYNTHKGRDGYVSDGFEYFSPQMSKFCGKVAKIIKSKAGAYNINLDNNQWVWHDWMFESKIEQQSISDIIYVSKNYILSDKVASFDELEQLADNHKSVAWKHNDNTYTLKPAAIFLSWSYRLLKLSLPNLYNVVLNDKANVIGEELYKQGLVNGESVQKVIDITRKILNKNE